MVVWFIQYVEIKQFKYGKNYGNNKVADDCQVYSISDGLINLSQSMHKIRNNYYKL